MNRYDPYWINHYISMNSIIKLQVKREIESHDCAKKCALQWPMSRQLKISLSLGQEGAGPDVIILRRNNSALISSSRCHHYFTSKRKAIDCYQNLILQQGPIYFSVTLIICSFCHFFIIWKSVKIVVHFVLQVITSRAAHSEWILERIFFLMGSHRRMSCDSSL